VRERVRARSGAERRERERTTVPLGEAKPGEKATEREQEMFASDGLAVVLGRKKRGDHAGKRAEHKE